MCNSKTFYIRYTLPYTIIFRTRYRCTIGKYTKNTIHDFQLTSKFTGINMSETTLSFDYSVCNLGDCVVGIAILEHLCNLRAHLGEREDLCKWTPTSGLNVFRPLLASHNSHHSLAKSSRDHRSVEGAGSIPLCPPTAKRGGQSETILNTCIAHSNLLLFNNVSDWLSGDFDKSQ